MEEHKVNNRRPLQLDTINVPVIVITEHYRIEGTLHVPHRGRISDYLNRTLGGESKATFISVTDASCYSIIDGELRYATEFLTVHRDHIQIIIPI